MMRALINIALFILMLEPALASGDWTTYVFLHANVIPMDRDLVMPDQTVIVRNGKVVSVNDAATFVVPDDAVRIDARGKYLIPGLADVHVHINEPEDLMLWLAHGVTTVLNLNGSPTHLRWREAIRDDRMEGPSLYTACPTIYIANTAREGDSLVRAYHAAGYDCIKIYNDVSAEAYDAIVRSAREYDMLTVGHIPRAPGFAEVLKAGMTIAHAEEYIYTIFHDSTDYAKIPEVVHATRDAHIPVIATLTAYAHIAKQVENPDSMLAQRGLRYIPGWIREDWSPEHNRYSKINGF
jgi:dihydroorotase-like cyclic amidohydrolase